MRADSGLNRLVYEYFEARILYGYYKYGDSLPSINKICQMFHLAQATVRAGLALLEKGGYVRVDPRTAPVVVYKAGPAGFRESAARYFVSRKAGIADWVLSGKLLFEPLWRECLMRWSDEDWKRFLDNMKHLSVESVSMPAALYILVFKAPDNRLFLNLYWETVRYIRFAYLMVRKDQAVLTDQELEGLSREEVISLLGQTFETLYGRITADLLSFIAQAQDEFDLGDMEQVPFYWNIYRKRPQMRYTLVSRILREIERGDYPRGTYLPSLPCMAQRYEVSFNTVRRSLSILDSMGITRSLQGKGTLVLAEAEKADLANPEIREGMKLYLDSLQLMTLTIKPVVQYTLENAPADAVEKLQYDVRQLGKNRNSYKIFEVVLTFIAENCRLNLVKECYNKLRELIVWGYPIALLRLREREFHMEYNDMVAQAGRYLDEGNAEAFSGSVKEFMGREYQEVRIFLESADTRQ